MTAPAINLAKPNGPRGADAGRPVYVERAELILALPDHKPLAALGLTPDPLQQLATALASVRTDAGERADVVFDLVPIAERRLARRRRRLRARSRRRGPSAYGEKLTGGMWGAGLAESFTAAWSGGTAGASSRSSQRLPRMTDVRESAGKFEPGTAVFALQLLLRTQAAHPQMALERMHQLLAVFAATSGENYLKAYRPRTRRAVAAFGRRFASGEFAPRKRQWMTVPELAGFLKPPTARCHSAGVVRSGGLVRRRRRRCPSTPASRTWCRWVRSCTRTEWSGSARPG